MTGFGFSVREQVFVVVDQVIVVEKSVGGEFI
jgi:hypothetical protein